jgi:hypothetical protein
MTTTERIQAIKNILFFGSVEAPAPAPVLAEFKEYPLKDGTSLSIDKLEVGGAVQLAGAPAADGEYELADGAKVKVVAGLISELTAAVVEPAPEEMSTPAQMMAAIQKFAEPGAAPDLSKMAVVLKACFEYCFGWEIRRAEEEASRATAIEAYKTGFEKQQQAVESLIELVADLKKPVGGPAEEPQNFKNQKQEPASTQKSWEDMTPLERRRASRQAEA